MGQVDTNDIDDVLSKFIDSLAARIAEHKALDANLASIYPSLLAFESVLLEHQVPRLQIDPCDVRRLLPDDIVRPLLDALPADKFDLGRNARNINGKLSKIAKA